MQTELDETALVWNTHRIRHTRNGTPPGRPINMYLLPELDNIQDYLQMISVDDLNACRLMCVDEELLPCEEEIFDLGCLYMEENSLNPPTNIFEAKRLYIKFRQWLLRQI